jgi:hypothetical protein
MTTWGEASFSITQESFPEMEKKTTTLEKWVKDMNRQFTDKEIQRTFKYVSGYSISPKVQDTR